MLRARTLIIAATLVLGIVSFAAPGVAQTPTNSATTPAAIPPSPVEAQPLPPSNSPMRGPTSSPLIAQPPPAAATPGATSTTGTTDPLAVGTAGQTTIIRTHNRAWIVLFVFFVALVIVAFAMMRTNRSARTR